MALAETDRYIDTQSGLDDLVQELLGEPVVAIDTEFHRERSYFPRVALLQIAWANGLALVDPLAVSLAPLAPVIDRPAVTVMHAAGQDLEVLERCCGTVPSELFDTQVAAGFIGMRSPSLAALHDRLLGIRLPKGSRLTDWLARPLGTEQLDYAAADVRHLLEIHERLLQRLGELERLQWARDECELLRTRTRGARDPDEAWLRIKESRHLRGSARGVAKAVAAWRERRAMDLDQPTRFILPDLAVVGIAQRPPHAPEDLRRVRGLEDRNLRGEVVEDLLAAVREGERADVSVPLPRHNSSLDERLRPAVTLVSAWLAQFAQDIAIDPALLATRSDIEELLRGDGHSRLGTGWRHDLVGVPIHRLVDGEAALAFEKGRLVLEDRSRH
ncbi:MAG: HRDC domain-containing protein [Acidimicrobiales bacterium]|nr:HRDC domain-containing protein [Acidimicrobiales bacterium]